LTALRSVENRFLFDKYPRLSAAKIIRCIEIN
jgi:hypothetical protein